MKGKISKTGARLLVIILMFSFMSFATVHGELSDTVEAGVVFNDTFATAEAEQQPTTSTFTQPFPTNYPAWTFSKPATSSASTDFKVDVAGGAMEFKRVTSAVDTTKYLDGFQARRSLKPSKPGAAAYKGVYAIEFTVLRPNVGTQDLLNFSIESSSGTVLISGVIQRAARTILITDGVTSAVTTQNIAQTNYFTSDTTLKFEIDTISKTFRYYQTGGTPTAPNVFDGKTPIPNSAGNIDRNFANATVADLGSLTFTTRNGGVVSGKDTDGNAIPETWQMKNVKMTAIKFEKTVFSETFTTAETTKQPTLTTFTQLFATNYPAWTFSRTAAAVGNFNVDVAGNYMNFKRVQGTEATNYNEGFKAKRSLKPSAPEAAAYKGIYTLEFTILRTGDPSDQLGFSIESSNGTALISGMASRAGRAIMITDGVTTVSTTQKIAQNNYFTSDTTLKFEIDTISKTFRYYQTGGTPTAPNVFDGKTPIVNSAGNIDRNFANAITEADLGSITFAMRSITNSTETWQVKNITLTDKSVGPDYIFNDGANSIKAGENKMTVYNDLAWEDGIIMLGVYKNGSMEQVAISKNRDAQRELVFTLGEDINPSDYKLVMFKIDSFDNLKPLLDKAVSIPVR